jgi:RimJ/RimL family protein N-acetyltransferase
MEVLQTERLILRRFCDQDLDAYASMCADPEVMRYLLVGKTLTREEAWHHMAEIEGHWQLRGYGLLAVEERESGTLVGRIGFLKPEGWPGFELAWTLARPYWGRGYATEGARAAMAYAFEELGQDKIISLIHPDNKPSIRLAERLGETLEDTIVIKGRKTLRYSISRASWKRKRNSKPEDR